MANSPIGHLGEFLSAREALGMAAMLAAGDHVSRALREVGSTRRDEAKRLMAAAGLDHTNVSMAVAVLEAISGAKALQRDLTPVWTMPGNEAEVGHLTSQFSRLVEGARLSVTAASYNFTAHSNMWHVLRNASERPGVQVVVYVDRDKGDANQVKAQMPEAAVYRSGTLPDGKAVVSHAKFVVIDHELLLITSANFSHNAERRNIEFGILLRDPTLAQSVEDVMEEKQGTLYERVPSATS